MDSETKRAGQLDRRSLLRGAGLAIGAAAATAATADEALVPAAKAQPQHGGYAETDHVRTYYRLARY